MKPLKTSTKKPTGVPHDEWLLANAIAAARAEDLKFMRGNRGVDQTDDGDWVACPQGRICVMGALTLSEQRWVSPAEVIGATAGNDHSAEHANKNDPEDLYFDVGAAFRADLTDGIDDDDGRYGEP